MCKPRYRAAVQKNIFVLASWYTGHLDRWWKSIEKAICILDEIFLTYGFLLTILSSATSYFLLSETKIIYEMCIPFSTNVFFSHTIYLPTDTTTFEMLFSLVPFGKERLGEEWKKRKNYFRKNALPIWNYNYKSLLRLLYQFKCTPASFPSEIGVPLPSGFAFQTNPFIWQAFLYMKCIGEAVGECISLQYVCSYVKGIRKGGYFRTFQSIYGKWQLLNI